MNLLAAIEAARAESADDAAGPSATRRRVLASIEHSPRRRLHVVVAAVIASMFGASAFAYYARAPHRAPSPAVAVAAPSTTPTGKAASKRHGEIDAPANAPAAEVVPTPVAELTTPVAPAKPAVKRPASDPASTHVAVEPARVAAEPAMPVAESAPAAQRDPELALYSSAHQLHFRDRNMASAVDAWNRYLAAAPDGKLAPEARFNRVVALVKLERWSEAAGALDALAGSTFRADELTRLRAVVSPHVVR